MISEKESTMERLRGRSKMSVHKEKCNVFTTLQVSILHTGMRSLTQITQAKLLPLIVFLSAQMPLFSLVELFLRQPYNKILRNKDQLLLCKTLTAKLSRGRFRGQSHCNHILHYGAKVITLLTLYVHIIKIIHLCYSELL